jgi:hypothetical protein
LAGSKTVKAGRSAIWHLRVRGEPPPTFTWSKKDTGKTLVPSDEFLVHSEDYQGGATAILQIFKTRVIKKRSLIIMNKKMIDIISLNIFL